MKHYLIVSVAEHVTAEMARHMGDMLRERMPEVEPVMVGGVTGCHLVAVPDAPAPTEISVQFAGREITQAQVDGLVRDLKRGSQ